MAYSGNKYGAKSTVYNGVKYPSIKEANYAKMLDWRIKGGEVKEWSAQPKFELIVNKQKICSYKLDFRFTDHDGQIFYVEVKGYPTREWKLKWKLINALWPLKEPEAKLLLV
jgi:hypothetical protein